MSKLTEALAEYREAREKLRELVSAEFPLDSWVKISFSGYQPLTGQVCGYHGDPTLVDCLLENGSVWTYNVEQLTFTEEAPYWAERVNG